MYIGAHILRALTGFDKHPNAHFPLMVFHGHFPDDISDFRTTPPDPDLKPDYSERFHLAGYNRIQQQEAYAFYKKWISPGFPRYIVIEIEHANPYYDDSYAVNSANLGPYGDALNKELIPYIEKKFRGLGAGWARFTYGGSTGGWEALATQVFYPDMYNGTFAACPDPVDFHAYTVVNLYADKNAYALTGQAASVERPAIRNYLGEIFATQRDANYMEYALGDHGRSGGQYDIWQAVFGPEGADGYPKPIFDKDTGDIDPAVAIYWRDHYDLTNIIARDWKNAGPETRRQDPHLCRQRRHLLSQQRRLFRASEPGAPEKPGLWRRSRLRRPRGALLERRPHTRQRLFAPRITTRSICRKSWRA